ncbi:hypothetical protein N9B82_05965 [Saprospiraceae bacterium]|nr:hypothetical protein [Saprospiraceae bacterium]
MFKKRMIAKKETVEFWQKMSSDSKEKRLQDHLFQFSVGKEYTTVKIKNEGIILNPEIDFIQARISDAEKVIIVETSTFIERLYLSLLIGTILFALLQLKSSILISIIILLAFGLIFLYNYRKINKAIVDFGNILENSIE